jgi:hypothetical protein
MNVRSQREISFYRIRRIAGRLLPAMIFWALGH